MLGLSPEEKVVLMMGGGDGVGGLGKMTLAVVKELTSSSSSLSPVVSATTTTSPVSSVPSLSPSSSLSPSTVSSASLSDSLSSTSSTPMTTTTSLIVICGHNQQMKQSLEKELRALSSSPSPSPPSLSSPSLSAEQMRKERARDGERDREKDRERDLIRRKTWFSLSPSPSSSTCTSIDSDLPSALPKVPELLYPTVIVTSNTSSLSPSLPSLSPSSNEKKKEVKVYLQGFVKNIDQYMMASDCLVTKAGPGTIAEAMICGLPLIISSFLPGQEAGNVDYCVNGGFGIYTGNNPLKVAKTVSTLLSNDKKLQEMSRLAKAQSRPDATISIAKDIGETLLKLHNHQQQQPLHVIDNQYNSKK